jgi:ATP-binding cassette subfamily B protein
VSEPLVGVDAMVEPNWTRQDRQVAESGLWRTLSALPSALRMVISLSWQASRPHTVLAAVLTVASGGATAFGLIATTTVFTSLLESGPTADRVLAALPAAVSMVVAFILRALLDSAATAEQSILRPLVEKAANERVHRAVSTVDLITFEDAEYVELLRQCLQMGVRNIGTSVQSISGLLSSMFNLAAAVVTSGLLHPVLPVLVLVSVLPQVWASTRAARLGFASYLRTLSRMRRLSVASQLLTDRTTAAEMRACTAGPALLAEYRRINTQIADEARRVDLHKTGIRLIGRGATGIGTGACYVALGFLLYNGSLPIGLASGAVVALRLASSALSGTMSNINALYESSLYLDLYTTLLDKTAAATRPPLTAQAPANPAVIRLDQVAFSYPGQSDEALRDISLTILRGQTVALVGENGSGKSTLAKLITGLYRPAGGSVSWDGVDLSNVDDGSVRQRIGLVMQEPARWPMTARDNIRIGRLDRSDPHGELLAWAAAESGAADVVAGLDLGLDTVLSRQFEGGRDLSGGQWQRIGVARGLYRDAPVLVADEPTAAMDARAEQAVFESLRRLGDDRTTILITHRLANVRHADQIIVLSAGRIVESGRHDDLVAAGGEYAQMLAIQAAAFTDSVV